MPIDAVAKEVRPLTGAEYLESIRDGREIWIYGERVKDVTTHPAFAASIRPSGSERTNPTGAPWNRVS